MSDLISVVVPVYNVEKYLKRCLDSIISQSYENLEIIIINDGSTDKSKEICEEYKFKDNRIKLINKKNEGLSAARNLGIGMANGKYISFIDSDDFIDFKFYEYMHNTMVKENADIVIANKCDVIEKTEEKIFIENNIEKKVFNNKEIIERYLDGNWIAAWDKLYKKDLFKEINFPIGKLNEDEAIMLHIFHKCSKVIYDPRAIYYYLRRETGSITTNTKNIKNCLDWIDNSLKNTEFVKYNYPNLEEKSDARYFSSLIWTLHLISYNKLSNYNYEKKEIKKLMYKNIVKIYKNRFINFERKLSATLMLINIMIYRLIRKTISGVKNA